MTCALELDDRALAIARDGRVLSVAPSAAASPLDPLGCSTRHFAQLNEGTVGPEVVSLVGTELRARLAADSVLSTDVLWCVVSAGMNADALGTVLAIARASGATIAGFVDAATVAAAALGLERDAVVVEIGLYHLAVTAIDAAHVFRKRRAVVSRAFGWVAVCDLWLGLIRSAMVNRARVDPLRDAAAERQLFAALPALAREAAERGSVTVSAGSNGQTTEISITRDQFAEAAQPVTRELLRLIAQLRKPGVATDLLIPAEIGRLSGFDAMLDALTGAGSRQLLLPEGFAAAAASVLEPPGVDAAHGTVPYLRHLGGESNESLRALAVERASVAQDSTQRASHVLYHGRAYALRDGPIVVGQAGIEANVIQLPEHAAGVSRRHCTFVATEADITLVDHSRFGTFVNGDRVIERARIHAGDRVRIGEPGFELAVIAVDRS